MNDRKVNSNKSFNGSKSIDKPLIKSTDTTGLKRSSVESQKSSNKRLKLSEENPNNKAIKAREIEKVENKENLPVNIKPKKGMKVKGSEKRKNTLQEKVMNSLDPIPLSSQGDEKEFKYQHSQRADVINKKAIPFSKSTKKELSTFMGNKKQFGEFLGLLYTPNTPGTPTKKTPLPMQMNVVMQGHDIIVDPIITNDNIISPARLNPSYTDLSQTLDSIVVNMIKREAVKEEKEARKLIARDIQRIGRGLELENSYKGPEWKDLTLIAGVVKADKARAPRATSYIDATLLDTESSFSERFGGKNPIYKGTGKGDVIVEGQKVKRGAAALRAIAAKANESDESTDFESE